MTNFSGKDIVTVGRILKVLVRFFALVQHIMTL